MSGTVGAVLILLGLFAWVIGVHYKARRYYDRPATP